MAGMNVDVAGAPVSFGVFELTPEGAATIAPDELLRALADAGYGGVDLGPMGYLGDSADLRARLTQYGLELAGGWVQLPLSDDAAFEASLCRLHEAISIFSDVAMQGPSRLPVPTLADGGSAVRQAAPGRGEDADPLDAGAWDRLTRNANRAADLVRAAGLEPTFHHHAGTYVESPTEIDRFLAEADLDLTLDTGHLFLAGGDVRDALQRWGQRINHVHVKDVDSATLRRAIEEDGGMPEVWSSAAFVALGEGDIDIAGLMVALEERAYDGWIVVEQDVLNPPDVSLSDFLAQRRHDQVLSRAALRAWA